MNKEKKKLNIPSLICNCLGTLLLIGVIAVLGILAVPQFLGYETYEIVSGSMAPSIPVGSLIFVQPAEGVDIEEGDVIAFLSEGNVIAHRVTANNVIEGTLNTKGDANAEEDFIAVPYSHLIGKVVKSVRNLGGFMAYLTKPIGKVYLLMVIACGVMFHILAGRLKR